MDFDGRMRARHRVGAWTGLLLAACPGTVAAQAIPNYGNYQSLTDNYRVGVQATNTLTGLNRQAAFQQSRINDVTDNIDPSNFGAFLSPLDSATAAISSVFDLRGSLAVTNYAQNSTDLTVNFVSPSGRVTVVNGSPCSFTFTGATRQDSFDALDDATDGSDTPTGRRLFRCLFAGFARYSPNDPLAGNPGSLQSMMIANALNLANGDSLVDADAGSVGDPWMVGATYTSGSAGRFDVGRIDGRIQRSFRIFEGNRALLKFDVPFSYAYANHNKAYTAQFGAGLEYPIIDQRWSIEPHVSYGGVYSGNAGSAGTILQGSIASRFAIAGLGRGRLVIGNMVGYGQTLNPPGVKDDYNPHIANWSFRNGFAYELPLKTRFGGRLTSVRASYTFTALTGDKLYSNTFHEATISFGLRGREESVRATRDLIRLNLSTTQARHYHTVTAGLGFRF